MDEMWSVISNIASICSIVGLPIALFQISGIKSKAKDTEIGLNKLLDMKDNEALELVSASIFAQQKELAQIQASTSKEGITPKNLDTRCKNIINELNVCIFQIPSKFEEATNSMEGSINCIQDYLRYREIVKLSEASDYLYSAIRGLKILKEKYTKSKIKDIANN